MTLDGPEIWGWHGRTLSSHAVHPDHGECWLRMISAPEDKAGGRIWEGNREAAVLFDGRVHKPVLHGASQDALDGYAHLAELHSFVSEPVCSSSPVLRQDLDLPGSWWSSLRKDLEQVNGMPTERVAVRQEWVDRSVPRFLDLPAPRITEWATAHGDLHAANLTSVTPVLLDWEGFGLAPVGYDAAMLLAYSLLAPGFAEGVREAFPVLATESGRVAQLVVLTELMQSASRGDHPELIPPLRALATELA
ncbi:phosphotransferase family protein [Streptomyces kronopolitis]